jgi:hypothetical protein
MQNDIRSKCWPPRPRRGSLRLTWVDREAMGSAHAKFVQYKEEGKLLSPDIVGGAIAGLAVCKEDEIRGFSGGFINWNDDAIAGFYKQ